MSPYLKILLTVFIATGSQHGLGRDEFDDIDRMLDASFEEADSRIDERFEAVHAAVERAFQGLTRKIERSWGDDTQLPSRRKWVTYSDDLSTRLTVDYSESEVVVETLVEDPDDMGAELEAMQELASELISASDDELDDRDVLVQAIRQELAEEELVAAEPEVAAPDSSEEAAEIAEPGEKESPSEDESSLLAQVLPEQSVLAVAKAPAIEAVEVVEESGVTKARVRLAFASDAQERLISNHLETVREYALTYEVPVSLILAIIETESSFNPRAVSPIPAFGLMQLVPRTAGIDAYQFVYGEKRVLSPEYLFHEDRNIELGTAYLGLVRDRYLRQIENPFSRYYCAVAAYNTGVGNVAKTFTGRTNLKEAARQINGMTEQEVFAFLVEELPAQETRDYLVKIVDRVEQYRHFDSG